MLNERKSKQILLSVLGVAILVVAVVGISYAAFTTTAMGASTNTIQTGTITMSYAEPSAVLNITGANTMSVSDGYAQGQHFDFTISGNAQAAMTIPYEITATPTVVGTGFDAKVRVGLKRGGTIVVDTGYVYTNGILASALPATTLNGRTGAKTLLKANLVLNGSAATTVTYQVYLWIDESATLSGSADSYSILINVDATASPLS